MSLVHSNIFYGNFAYSSSDFGYQVKKKMFLTSSNLQSGKEILTKIYVKMSANI